MRTWLSPAGTLSAALVGSAVWAGTGWRGFVLLLVFLAGSSMLTPGGGRRRPIQVFANGGIAAAGALLARWYPALAAGFVGALAAAAADTWATEIGGRSGAITRLVTSGASVPPGTSGGVTIPGTAGGLAGAAVIAAAAGLLGLAPFHRMVWLAGAGAAGMLTDSLLGATIQARWRCTACGRTIETPSCPCAGATRHVSGLRWITNDTVNLAATLTGAIGGALTALMRNPPLP